MTTSKTQHARLPELLERLPALERDVSQRLSQTFQDAGRELFLVGGVVRDLLLERNRADLDFATSAVPDETRDLGRAAGCAALYDVGAAYGTIGMVFRKDGHEDLTVEVTTYRSEVYPTRDRRPAVTPRRQPWRGSVAARLHDQCNRPRCRRRRSHRSVRRHQRPEPVHDSCRRPGQIPVR